MKYKILIAFSLLANLIYAKEIFVSTKGNDNSSGTKEKPYATFSKALSETKKYAGKEPVTVWFTEGGIILTKPLK